MPCRVPSCFSPALLLETGTARSAGIIPPNTRLLFERSTFGADRVQVVTACP